MQAKHEQLENAALDVLKRNDQGTHIAPNREIYPNGWLWDGAFVAHGLSHLDPERAASELRYIFEGQWDNGMVPHMRLDRQLFNVSRLLNRNAPQHIRTSGFTQPPILAEAVQKVSEQMPSDDRQAFVYQLFNPLANYHQWVYRERNLNGNGLFTTVHPYETGMDSSPALTQALHLQSRGLGNVAIHSLKHILPYFRQDIKHTDKDQRASSEDVLLSARTHLSLMQNRFDYRRLKDHHRFHIEDVSMTSTLMRNNQVLEELSDEYKLPLPDNLRAHFALTRLSLESLWDDVDQMYYHRDAISGEMIKVPTVASLMPIHAAELITQQRFAALTNHLENPQTFGSDFGVPTVPFSSPDFQEKRYWCGPSWPFTDWLLSEGLRRGGRPELARKLGSSLVARTQRGNFDECFSAKTGEGLCITDFSPTAALAIDVLHRYELD